ncbi:MAG: hypothetical protein KF760_03155 [Candidatus Eremiobacteraeota bacterium]|nr:hypothetical protein [Candidatus Eremiobacteraeota bacterium]
MLVLASLLTPLSLLIPYKGLKYGLGWDINFGWVVACLIFGSPLFLLRLYNASGRFQRQLDERERILSSMSADDAQAWQHEETLGILLFIPIIGAIVYKICA